MPLKHSLHFYGQFLIPWKPFFQKWKGLLCHYQSHFICFANNLDLIKKRSKTMCVPQDNEEAIEPNNKQDCAFFNEIDEQDESFNRRFNIELDRETKQEERQKPVYEDTLFGEAQKSNKTMMLPL